MRLVERILSQPGMVFPGEDGGRRPSGRGIAEEPDGEKRPPPLQWYRLLGRPWSHLWRMVLVGGMGVSVVLGAASRGLPLLAPVYAFAAAFCIPIAVCTFFSELAGRRDACAGMMSAGIAAGIASLFLTLGVASVLPPAFGDYAPLAGIIEEPCKGAALIAAMAALGGIGGGALRGLAIGSAVGAGFAAPETIVYAYANGMQSGEEPSDIVLVVRGLCSPFMHVSWTAALGGALGRFGGGSGCAAGAVGVLLAMIVCHGAWNAATGLGALTLIPWVLIFHFATGEIGGWSGIGSTKKEVDA